MEVIRSIRRLESLRDEWNDLAARHEQAFLRHEWFDSCARALHSEQDLHVVVIRRQGELVAAAPLAVERGATGRRLRFLGSADLYEPAGFLYRNEKALEALLAAVLGIGLPAEFQRLNADSPVPQTLRKCLGWPGRSIVLQTAPSYAVSTELGWPAYQGSLSSRITGNLKRVRRRAERTLGVRIERLCPSLLEVDSLLDLLLTVEGSGWKGRSGTALDKKPRLATFFRLYAKAAAEQGLLRVFVLRLAERVGAVEFDVEVYGRLWQLKIGYDEALREYYPGLQLLQESIRYAFDSGLRGFEFLGSAEGWEARWNPVTREYLTVLGYPGTAVGVWALAVDLLVAAGRRARRMASRSPLHEFGNVSPRSPASPPGAQH